MRKKFLIMIVIFFYFFIYPSSNYGFVSDSDFQDLQIKVYNLQTIIQNQNKLILQLQAEIKNLKDELNQKIDMQLIGFKTEILQELQSLRDEVTIISARIDDLETRFNLFKENVNSTFSQINSTLQTLGLSLENLTSKIAFLNQRIDNLTQRFSNLTQRLEENQKAFLGFKNRTSGILKKMEFYYNTLLTNATSQNKTIGNQTALLNAKLEEIRLFQTGYTLYTLKRYKEAIKVFEKYVKRFPYGRWIGDVYYYLGDCYFYTKDYEDAILSYQKLIERPGWHPKKPDALLKQAIAFKALGDDEAYKILLKKVLRLYPQSKAAHKAEKLLKITN